LAVRCRRPGIVRATDAGEARRCNWDEDEAGTSGNFLIVTFHNKCNGTLEAVYGYNEVLSGGIEKNSFQAVECAATDADTLSGAQERTDRTLAVKQEQAA
jgi:hypothetical protein